LGVNVKIGQRQGIKDNCQVIAIKDAKMSNCSWIKKNKGDYLVLQKKTRLD
jgi:hypothetical protein